MGARKRRREITVEVVWEINPNPAPHELKRWHDLWALLIKTTHMDTTEKPEVLKMISRNSREFSKNAKKTTFRCTCCGQTWPAKYLPDGKWAPDWWKCPNKCYKSR
jgi:hypothetical protein